MARAIANCTCSVCGAKFERVEFKSNRAQADAWKEWAEEHFTICPECYQKQQMAKAEALAAELGLPQIAGKSDKQIAYAASLRAKYLVKSGANEIKLVRKLMAVMTPEKVREVAEKNGVSDETVIRRNLEHRALSKAYVAAYESDAGKIIDALR